VPSRSNRKAVGGEVSMAERPAAETAV